jgi:transposase
MDLRQKVMEAVEGGGTTEEIGERFGIAGSCVRKWRLRLQRRGTLEPDKPPGRKREFATKHDAQLKQAVEGRPDATRVELAEPVDESGLNLAMTRAYARALRGVRALGHVPKNWGDSITIAAGIALRGLIAPLRLIGSMTGDVFEAYIEQFVCPELRPGDVVVVDNLSAHKRAAVGALVENAKASIRFLPPYSPDLSPIEPCWSKVKHIIRSLQARTLEALDLAIVQGLRAVTCSDARG